MEEILELLMFVSSFQMDFDLKMDDEWKGGTMGWGDNKKTREEEVGAGKEHLNSYCS